MATKRRAKPKWMKNLKARDIRHLKESLNKVTLAGFISCRESQRKHNINCPECRHIALVIGIEKPGGAS